MSCIISGTKFIDEEAPNLTILGWCCLTSSIFPFYLGSLQKRLIYRQLELEKQNFTTKLEQTLVLDPSEQLQDFSPENSPYC